MLNIACLCLIYFVTGRLIPLPILFFPFPLQEFGLTLVTLEMTIRHLSVNTKWALDRHSELQNRDLG